MCMESYHTQLNVCMREKGPAHCIAVQNSAGLPGLYSCAEAEIISAWHHGLNNTSHFLDSIPPNSHQLLSSKRLPYPSFQEVINT